MPTRPSLSTRWFISPTLRSKLADRALLIAVALLHLLALAWLALHQPDDRAAPVDARTTMTLADYSGTPAPARTPPSKPKPAKPPVVKQAILPLPLPVEAPAPPSAASTSAATPGTAGGCTLERQAVQAIVTDPAAMQELAQLPAGLRTASDAVALWNGVWLASDPVAGPPALGHLRLLVEQIVQSAPSQCRDAAMIGPVLLPVPENGRTTMIAIGSGSWRWSDLLGPSASCQGAPNGQCPAPIPAPSLERPTI